MKMPEEHAYKLTLNWDKGRIGTFKSDELEETIKVATPPEFPGGVEGIWSPEHLYIASVSSCFMTSFLAVAEYSKLEFESLSIESEGILSKTDGKYVMSKIILRPILVINDENQESKAYRLLEKADEICLITRSIKTEVVTEPEVEISVSA